MIKSIFFARFDPEKGPIVLYATPSNFVSSSDPDLVNPSANSASPNPANLPLPSSPQSPRSTKDAAASSLSAVSAPTPVPGPLPPLPPPVTLSPASSRPTAVTSPVKPEPLLHFPAVSNFIIPHQSLCNRPLSFCASGLRILGHPVCIKNDRYPRNEFIFNLCLVLDETIETSAYVKVVNSVARLLKRLELESEWLSRDERETAPDDDPAAEDVKSGTSGSRANAWGAKSESKASRGFSGSAWTAAGSAMDEELQYGVQRSKVQVFCETLMEDLNCYGECMIPVDDATTLNLRLSPTLAPPPPVKPWYVPVPTTNLLSLVDSNWDIVMLALLPHIDGISTIAKIAATAGRAFSSKPFQPRADPSDPAGGDAMNPDDKAQEEWKSVSIDLAMTAISDLLYYGLVIILPPLTYSAVYAPTPGIRGLIHDDPPGIVAECIGIISQRSPPPPTRPPPASNVPSTPADCPESSRASSSASKRPVSVTSHEPKTHSPLHQDLASASPAASATAEPRDSRLTHMDLIELYTSLRLGLSLKDWYVDLVAPSGDAGSAPVSSLAHAARKIDPRAFVAFGLAKRWLYRCQKVAALPLNAPRAVPFADATVVGTGSPASGGDAGYIPGLSKTPKRAKVKGGRDDAKEDDDAMNVRRFCDGQTSFDEMCTVLGIGETELLARLKAAGDVMVVSR